MIDFKNIDEIEIKRGRLNNRRRKNKKKHIRNYINSTLNHTVYSNLQ